MFFDILYCMITPNQPNYPYRNFKSRVKSVIPNARYRRRGSALMRLPPDIRMKIYEAVFSRDICCYTYRHIGPPRVSWYYSNFLKTRGHPPDFAMLCNQNSYTRWDARNVLLVCSQIYVEALICFYRNVSISILNEGIVCLPALSNPYLRINVQRITVKAESTEYSFFKHLPMLKEVTMSYYTMRTPPDVAPRDAFKHSILVLAFRDQPSRSPEVVDEKELTRLERLAKRFPHIQIIASISYIFCEGDPDISIGRMQSTVSFASYNPDMVNYSSFTNYNMGFQMLSYHLGTDTFVERDYELAQKPPRIIKPDPIQQIAHT